MEPLGGWGPTETAYLKLDRARLGGVKGVEEVVGIGGGVCKAEKERQGLGCLYLQKE